MDFNATHRSFVEWVDETPDFNMVSHQGGIYRGKGHLTISQTKDGDIQLDYGYMDKTHQLPLWTAKEVGHVQLSDMSVSLSLTDEGNIGLVVIAWDDGTVLNSNAMVVDTYEPYVKNGKPQTLPALKRRLSEALKGDRVMIWGAINKTGNAILSMEYDIIEENMERYHYTFT